MKNQFNVLGCKKSEGLENNSLSSAKKLYKKFKTAINRFNPFCFLKVCYRNTFSSSVDDGLLPDGTYHIRIVKDSTTLKREFLIQRILWDLGIASNPSDASQ